LLYTGEQFDTGLQQYYLRARYYNQNNGRFNQIDPFAGSSFDPQSLHKYTYAHNDPVNGVDPSGRMTLPELVSVLAIITIVAGLLFPALNAAAATYFIGQYEKQGAPSAYVVALSVTALAGFGPDAPFGWGVAASMEFLYIYGKAKWYAYLAIGGAVGYSGPTFTSGSISLGAGPVWGVYESKDYTEWYLTSDLGGAISPRAFRKMFGIDPSFSSGFSLSVFWSPSYDSKKGTVTASSAGFKAGPLVASSSGANYSFSATYYEEVTDEQPFKRIVDYLNNTPVTPPSDSQISSAGNFSSQAGTQISSQLSAP
jgi:RHS repeat-associated protein